MLSRIYPDVTTEEKKKEIYSLFRAVDNQFPGLLREMQPNERQLSRFNSIKSRLPIDAGVLSVNGPLLNDAIRHFAAKLGIALHFEQTGNVLTSDGVIAVGWYTNFDAYSGEIPNSIRRMVGPVSTLRQGTKEVSSQFAYRWLNTPDGKRGAYVARFREAFLTVSLVSEEAFNVEMPPEFEGLFAPGFLRTRK